MTTMARNEYYMTEKLKVLDLFSGLGGFSLGLERTGHFETVAFCDNDKYSKLIIDKHWKGKKVYEDVREITKEKLIADGIELPDVITGGFPCQPFSVAGKQKGTSDDRHLWPEMFRIIKALKPRIVVGENVRGIVNIQDGMVFETVCTNLEDEGYEVQAFNIPAAGVGAPHRRERIWIIATLGDPKYDGPLTDEIGRRNEEINGGTEKRQNSSFEFERTSGREDNAIMENANNNGFERGFSETRNETITGKKSSSNGIEDTNNSSRRSNGRGDQSQPTTDGTIQRLRDVNEEESSKATGVRGLHERADNSHDFNRENRHQENNSRALVQKGQTRVQSSISGRLATDQTTLGNNQIRQRDDNATLDRVENGHEDVENTRRTLRSRGELGAADEDETRKENAYQLERSSSASRSNVADTESIESNVGGLEQRQRERSGQREVGGASGNDANTNGERLQRLGSEHKLRNSEEEEQTSGNSWWLVEPNVGRVAHGVSGRVHRLKGLGNSIVPQIAEEIGRAIIKAERE